MGEGMGESAIENPIAGTPTCCARAMSGRLIAAPPTSVMNPRRSVWSSASQRRIAGYRIGNGQSGGIGANLQPRDHWRATPMSASGKSRPRATRSVCEFGWCVFPRLSAGLPRAKSWA